jgi:hypothetical protein
VKFYELRDSSYVRAVERFLTLVEVLRIERFFVRAEERFLLVVVSGDVSSELQTCSIQRGLRRSEYLRIERFFVCSEERFLSVVKFYELRDSSYV